MAGHSALAKMIKMDAGVIAALREGRPLPDAKLEALHRFATIVVRERGFASDADVDAFLAAGYTRQNVFEVILGVATKVMSNYTNHIVHTQYDPFMKATNGRNRSTRARRPDLHRRKQGMVGVGRSPRDISRERLSRPTALANVRRFLDWTRRGGRPAGAVPHGCHNQRKR